MSFIIEIIPKKENESIFVYIVRAQNGFPLAVVDSMLEASNFIAEQHQKALESLKSGK